MAALAEENIECHVGRIQVRRGGSGRPVVYLHSSAGEGEGLAFLERLADHADVIAPMFPGFDQSEGIEQIDDMEDAVFHLLDLFDQLGLDSPAVVGLSLGGWMAAEVGVRYPERVSGLVLINPAGLYIEGAEIKDIFGRPLDELAADLFADQTHPMAQMMTAMAAVDPSQLSFEMIKPAVQTMAATARLAWDPYLHDPKLLKRLHRVTAPTLIVHGTGDTLIPRAHPDAYAAAIPGARLVELEGAGHMAALERADEVAELVADFLRS